MKNAFLGLFALFLSSPALAVDIPIKQVGVVCNSPVSAQAYYLAKAEPLRKYRNEKRVARGVSTLMHWCIVGKIKRKRPSVTVEGLEPAIERAESEREDARRFGEILNVVASMVTFIPLAPFPVMSDIGEVFKIAADAPLPDWHLRVYTTERGRAMYLFAMNE